MPDHADPNHRPLKVIKFLAAHAPESFTLAELARMIGMSKGSAHRVMTALTEAGFVARHPRHKTYALGLALVAVGEAALSRYPGVGIARREMARLHADLQVGCGATAIVNDEYLLLGREGTPRTYDGLSVVGERRLVVPSIGIGQMAWRSEAEIAAYIQRGAAYLAPEVQAHLAACMPAIRQRGYAMASNGLGMQRLIDATRIPLDRQACDIEPGMVMPAVGIDHASEFQMLVLAEAEGKGVNYIAAPVFSPEGEVCLEIVVSGFPGIVAAGDAELLAARVVQAADVVTAEIRGRKPRPR